MKQLLLTCLTLFLWCAISAVNLQAQTVTGTVTDASGDATLPGVNVVVEGTSIGTVTDVDGSFSLDVPSLNETLVISYIGYQTQEIPLNGRSDLDVSLESQVLRGEEMVVTAFGVQREQRSLSYSTQGVQTEQMTEARELNVMNSLQGRVAGLSINQSGSGVGSSTRVVLRGNRSISGDSQPLYVVDGVPIRGNPTDLNPDNIASLNVLKGPNAAALYGSAAQNGAIVIETHRGQAGVVNVSLSNTFQLQQPDHYMDFQNEYGQGTGGVYQRNSEDSWGPRMEGQLVDHWSLDPDDAGTQYAFSPQGNDARHDVFQAGYSNASNINASVGTETSTTVFNYTYTDAEGIIPGNQLQRHNVSVRLNNQLTDRLSLDSKLDYMQQGIDNAIATGESNFNPMRQIYTTPPNIRSEHLQNFDFVDDTGLRRHNWWNPQTTTGANPYWMIHRNLSEDTRDRVIALTSLTFDVTEQVAVMGRVSYDGESRTSNSRIYNDTFTRAEQGSFAVGRSERSLFMADALVSYTEDLTEDWLVSANVGASLERQEGGSLSSNTGGALLVPNFFALSNTSLPSTGFNPGSRYETQSVYAFGQLGWRDAVYLDITGRNDWSSTLPADNRSYFYPSVGLSVILSDLIPEFPDLFTFARLRASYAQVGNSAPAFRGSRTASFSAGGNHGYLRLNSTLPNENLRPEQTDAYEIGLDLRFMEGRLGFDITAYQTNTFDQLFTIALPWGSGASEFFTNGGDVENKGIEMMLTTTPVQTLSFNWDFNVQYSRNRNMVNEINDARPSVEVSSDYLRSFRIEQGRPYGEIYSRGFLRDDDGNVLVTADGVPRVTSGMDVLVGNFSPDWQGAISNELSYRNFSASFLIEHRQGGEMVSMTNAVLAGHGIWGPTAEGREGGLVFGDNIFSDETAVGPNGNVNTEEIDAETLWRAVGGRNAPAGEVFSEDATNTRLREVTLGYNLPQSILGRLPVSNVQLSLVGRNLLFIYKAADSLEPDFFVGTGPASEGFQSFAPPTTRTVGANLKIDF
ncbi:MAG: SusC/RagA family TonB-linked outer membrane protein [Balneolaceae bacterium]